MLLSSFCLKRHHGYVLGSVQVPMCSYYALRFCFSTFHIILRLELSAGSYSGCWFLNAIPVCEGLQIVSNQSDCYSRFLVFGGPCRVGCGLLASKKTCNERMQSQVKVLTPSSYFSEQNITMACLIHFLNLAWLVFVLQSRHLFYRAY